jgi:hypothetical protein
MNRLAAFPGIGLGGAELVELLSRWPRERPHAAQ